MSSVYDPRQRRPRGALDGPGGVHLRQHAQQRVQPHAHPGSARGRSGQRCAPHRPEQWESPPANSPAYKLRIQHGGNVGGGATWAWKGSDEADTSYRHDWPTRVPRRMWAAAAQTGETAGAVDMVTCPAGASSSWRAHRRVGQRDPGALDRGRDPGWRHGGRRIVLASEDSADLTYRSWSMVAAAGYPSVVYWEDERSCSAPCATSMRPAGACG